MQVYRIKMQPGTDAKFDQVNKDGYVSDESGEPYLYSPQRAIQKSKFLGGKPEKFGKKYVTSARKIIQFDEISFEPKTLRLLRDVAVYKHDSGMNQFFCYANVFEELLQLNDTEDIQDELKALAYMCQHYDYVHVLLHI
jgi:hypothetical protein